MAATTAPPEAAHRAASPHSTPESVWLGAGLVLFGMGAALVAVLGPLIAGVIEYHVSEGAANQIIGGDVVGLALVAPASVVAGVLVGRHPQAGFVLALGPALYALYMYSQLALGGDVFRYPGNSERFFFLFLGLFILAGAIVIRAWTKMDWARLPDTSPRLDRAVAGFFLVVASFLAVGLHLPGLIDAWGSEPSSTEYLADPAVFWLVKFMDLGLVVPGLVATAVGLLRGAPWAGKAKYAAVGWAALLGASVAGMAIVMQATGDPAATTVNTAAFSVFAAIALGMAWVLYRPVLRPEPPGLPPGDIG